MRRKDVANFFTAERRISPLTACGLLVVAGIIAGSLNLVAPVEQGAMTAAVEPVATRPAATTPGRVESKAPRTCEEAITSALGQNQSPSFTNTANNQNGVLDSCIGAMLKAGKTASNNRADYECVGRGGQIRQRAGTITSTTFPSRAASSTSCSIQVCNYSETESKYVCGPQQKMSGLNVNPAGLTGAPSIPLTAGTANDPLGGGPSAPATQPIPTAQLDPNCDYASGTCQTAAPTPEKTVTPTPETGSRVRVIEMPQYDPSNGAFTGYTQVVIQDDRATTPDPSSRTDLTPGSTEATPAATTPADQPRTAESTFTQPAAAPAAEPQVTKMQVMGPDNARIPTEFSCVGTTCTAFPQTRGEFEALQAQGVSCTATEVGGYGFCMTRNPSAAQAPGGPQQTAGTPQQTPGTNQTPGTPQQTPPFYPQAPASGPTQPASNPSSGNNGIMGGLTSFLSGLAKGFLGSALQSSLGGQGQTCPTDPNAYAQYQQQYNYQLQLYNQQLQQYNYQLQMQQYNGYTGATPYPPTPPVPCQPGTGQNGGIGSANGTSGTNGTNATCPQAGAMPNAQSCSFGTWQQKPIALSSGLVCPVWQCVASNTGQAPTALLTCDPLIAENNTTIQMSFSCTNAASSTGFGFSTGGAISGITSAIISNPPATASGINYVLRCDNGAATAASQCTVQIARPSLIVRAQPASVLMGATTTIGWTSSAMKSCMVSSVDQPDFTDRNESVTTTSGVAVTSPITGNTTFNVTCLTQTDRIVSQDVTVTVQTPGTVSSSIDNRTNVPRGTVATVQWSFPDAPDTSAVSLWLVDTESGQVVAVIAGNRARTGSYQWSIPFADEPCDLNSSRVCGTDLAPGKAYLIQAASYTPANAGLGQFADPSLPEPTYLEKRLTRTFTIGL